ncbi:hypothetical protein RRG08_047880 [Elysia crispata]|uniref:Integrase catalytic domain-containing protein n=1 Tax=Elysia crispata TaxID=231223 RepID=A0AAE0ZLF0_9GAST|nr:hypothetical protein RRG08_047880 [Elysia crispata]
MGIGATKKRIYSRFTWPGIMQDTIRFVKSFITCQKHCNKLPRLPVQQADIVDRPFDKIAIDIVGPFTVTDSKCRYILTLVDTATRWPEAVPLRDIRTTDVASALFNIFSRLGVPKQILSDNGQQLVSKAMSELMEMIGIERRLSTPYHAQSNGIVEKFNGTLKNMLHKLTADKPHTWDKLIPAVLFAFRKISNTSTGYPPFTLMYGRQVRGPADIIADICSGTDNIVEEYTFVHDYANRLYQDINKACKIATENAKTKLAEYRETRSSHTRYREFSNSILLPQDGNNLFMRYQGPYIIRKVDDDNNYVCQVGKNFKTYHANLLMKFEERQPIPPDDIILPHAAVSFIKDDDVDLETSIEFHRITQKEFPLDVMLDEKLSPNQQNEIRLLLQGFPDTLSDLPGRTQRNLISGRHTLQNKTISTTHTCY